MVRLELARLNEAYDKDLGRMQAVIDKLTGRIKNLTERISEYDNFMKIKGLLEEFKEFIRPKSIAEKLQKNKQVVEIREPNKVQRRRGDKKHDIAI